MRLAYDSGIILSKGGVKMIESEFLEENKRIINDLRKIPSLAPFEDADLAALLKISKIQKFHDGEIICKEGSYDSYIYFLIYGSVEISKKGKTLAILKRRGDIFGEMSVMDVSARTASCVAAADTVCLASDTSHIERLSGKEKMAFSYVLYRVFAEVLAERLRMANEKLTQGADWKVW